MEFTADQIAGILEGTVEGDGDVTVSSLAKDDLDDILKIFIRVNSGGTILSKTDLLFSTIVATWENGRDEIETFLKDLNLNRLL